MKYPIGKESRMTARNLYEIKSAISESVKEFFARYMFRIKKKEAVTNCKKKLDLIRFSVEDSILR